MCCTSDIFLGFIAILFPPLPVWVKTGICSADSLINICLCMLGYLPGLLHSWYIIAKYPDLDRYEIVAGDAEGGRVTYVFVQPSPGLPPNPHGPMPHAGYGTLAQQKPMEAPNVHQQQNGTWGGEAGTGNAGEGSANAVPPPTYAQAVTGDNKVQTHE